jgi:hypothetical protein
MIFIIELIFKVLVKLHFQRMDNTVEQKVNQKKSKLSMLYLYKRVEMAINDSIS